MRPMPATATFSGSDIDGVQSIQKCKRKGKAQCTPGARTGIAAALAVACDVGARQAEARIERGFRENRGSSTTTPVPPHGHECILSAELGCVSCCRAWG